MNQEHNPYLNDIKTKDVAQSNHKRIWRQRFKTIKEVFEFISPVIVVIFHIALVIWAVLAVISASQHESVKDMLTVSAPEQRALNKMKLVSALFLTALVSVAFERLLDSIKDSVKLWYRMKLRNEHGVYGRFLRTVRDACTAPLVILLIFMLFWGVYDYSFGELKYTLITGILVIPRALIFAYSERKFIIPNKALPPYLSDLRRSLIYQCVRRRISDEYIAKMTFIVDHIHPRYWFNPETHEFVIEPKGVDALFEKLMNSEDAPELKRLYEPYKSVPRNMAYEDYVCYYYDTFRHTEPDKCSEEMNRILSNKDTQSKVTNTHTVVPSFHLMVSAKSRKEAFKTDILLLVTLALGTIFVCIIAIIFGLIP